MPPEPQKSENQDITQRSFALTFTDFEMLLNKLSKVDLDPSFGFCLAL